MTNKKNDHLKCCHVYNFFFKIPYVASGRLTYTPIQPETIIIKATNWPACYTCSAQSKRNKSHPFLFPFSIPLIVFEEILEPNFPYLRPKISAFAKLLRWTCNLYWSYTRQMCDTCKLRRCFIS